MLPVGLLMKEHRLIEKMIGLLKEELDKIILSKNVDHDFLDKALDFIKIYADKCHHGKEEDILFRDLSGKKLSAEHKNILNELKQEHALSRKTTQSLSAAKEAFLKKEKNSVENISKSIKILVELYPRHIEKEDKHFFLPVMEYFSEEEKEKMINEFLDFDCNLIHERYAEIVLKLENKGREGAAE